jgi:hypothetical protein
MLKAVVVYADAGQLGPIRNELAAYGTTSVAAIGTDSMTMGGFMAPYYKGTDGCSEMFRLECWIDATHVAAVKEVIFRHAGKRNSLYVLSVDESLRQGTVTPHLAAAA